MLDDALESLDLTVDITAQFTEAQHAERIADLLQQLKLRNELRRAVHASANEDIQNVLDGPQVLLDRRSDRLHQPGTRCRQCAARVLDLLVTR